MFELLIAISPLLVTLLFILIATRKCPAECPDCHHPMSRFQSPFTKTKRQWMYGGFLCSNCGCELNLDGTKVSGGGGSELLSPWRARLLIAVMIGLGLAAPLLLYLLWAGPA